MSAAVTAASNCGECPFTKPDRGSIRLLVGTGVEVEGDVHTGVTVRHRARRAGSHQSNLRQAPLIHEELFAKVGDDDGVKVTHDGLGENTSTRRTELLGLPVGTLLRIGDFTALEAGELRTHAMLGTR
ncbi:hypothetical protein [Streptomyces sp. NPDC055794]